VKGRSVQEHHLRDVAIFVDAATLDEEIPEHQRFYSGL